MATKLGVFNLCLLELGERPLSSLSEARPPRYALDAVYDGALLYALEQGLWNFGMRAQEIAYDPNIDPAFGYDYALEKPSDLVRLNTLTTDAAGLMPLEEYADEAGYWYANSDAVYTTYVSNNASYGLDLTLWPATFERYFVLLLAERICSRETASESKLERLKRDCKKALIDARSKDAMAGPNYFRDKSNWLRARNSGSRLNGTGRGL